MKLSDLKYASVIKFWRTLTQLKFRYDPLLIEKINHTMQPFLAKEAVLAALTFQAQAIRS